jgi:isopentenyl phosphate kinase
LNKLIELDNIKMSKLDFLKLGGSLITDKNEAHTHRPEVLARLGREIAAALEQDPGIKVVIGHGSGSFGHVAAKKYGTRSGVHSQREWDGFVEVWWEAINLNRHVMDALHAAGLPVVSLPPLASVTAQDGQVAAWDLAPLTHALQAGLIPVVFGDVVFDLERGGTILSTEDLFAYLARRLPQVAGLAVGHLLLAGIEAGVWADFPLCTQLVEQITPNNYTDLSVFVGESRAADVTGGMATKVEHSLALVKEMSGLVVRIFSGETPGAVEKALLGQQVGTVIRAVEK